MGTIKLDHDKIVWIAENKYPVTADETLFSPTFARSIAKRLNREQLLMIGRWKAARAQGYLNRNEDESISAFSEAAFAAKNPRLAAWTLQYLNGVGVRMASAILTVHNPRIYTVYDVRAVKTLRRIDYKNLGVSAPTWLDEKGVLDSTYRYADYLKLCGDIAKKCTVSMRELDRCLWRMNGHDIDIKSN